MTPFFNTGPEYLRMHVWCKFDNSSSNLWRFIDWTNQNSQNYLEGQGQWPLFSIPDKSIPICMFGANLVIPSQICDKLFYGQAKFPRILSQNGHNDLEGHGQWPLFFNTNWEYPRMHICHKFDYSSSNMWRVIVCDELWCGQSTVHGRTDRRTDGKKHMRATTTPLQPERTRGKKELIGIIFIFISITISFIFNWKQIQLESMKYQLSPWLIIIQMAIDYIEITLCASKLHVFNIVVEFCPDSTDVAKYNHVMMYIL